MPPLYALAYRTVGTGLRVFWRLSVDGLHHVPVTGGAILAGNHLSVADEYFLAAVVPRHVAFWAKAEYFAGRVTGPVVTGLGAIPVHRGGGRAALAAFDAAVPVLRSGGLVAVYPEGTRSPDGRLYRGRTGVVRLAHRAGVPIVPVGVRGTDRVQPVGARFPRPHRVALAFGEPLEVTVDGPADVRAHTDELMDRVRRLTGQEYVPSYAPIPDRAVRSGKARESGSGPDQS
jgi:1-acyl-sn-glycerol-3-phosphate acyltransferase